MTSAHHRTPKRWEVKVANDLTKIGITAVRVWRESFDESCPDIVQVPPGIDFFPKPYWELVRQYPLGPVVGECKTRRHEDVPAYLVKTLQMYEKVSVLGSQITTRRVPLWLKEMVRQVERYKVTTKPSVRFVAIKKKRGKGKGNGPCEFVVVNKVKFSFVADSRGVEWEELEVFPYKHFLEVMRYYALRRL